MSLIQAVDLKSVLIVAGSLLGLVTSSAVMANSNWSQSSQIQQRQSYSQTRPEHDRIFQNNSNYGYRGYADPYGTPLSPQRYPTRPPNHRPHSYPAYGYPERPYPVYPQQNGVTIIYNHHFPTQTQYHSQSHGFVNGNGTIESSSYMLISDWQRYHLPAPNVGMHWIYQNGRYLQVPNER